MNEEINTDNYLSYDYLDNEDYFKRKQKKKKLIYSQFDRLLKEKDDFYRKFLYRGYCVAKGNISLMARGLRVDKKSLYKYLEVTFGKNYRVVLDNFRLKELIRNNQRF